MKLWSLVAQELIARAGLLLSEYPAGVQGALADYATWRILSGGGRTQQLRADFYWQRFLIERQRAQRVQEQRMGPRRRVNRYR